jgi:hypothetical protein
MELAVEIANINLLHHIPEILPGRDPDMFEGEEFKVDGLLLKI